MTQQSVPAREPVARFDARRKQLSRPDNEGRRRAGPRSGDRGQWRTFTLFGNEQRWGRWGKLSVDGTRRLVRNHHGTRGSSWRAGQMARPAVVAVHREETAALLVVMAGVVGPGTSRSINSVPLPLARGDQRVVRRMRMCRMPAKRHRYRCNSLQRQPKQQERRYSQPEYAHAQIIAVTISSGAVTGTRHQGLRHG
jgi:hypothetical protein